MNAIGISRPPYWRCLVGSVGIQIIFLMSRWVDKFNTINCSCICTILVCPISIVYLSAYNTVADRRFFTGRIGHRNRCFHIINSIFQTEILFTSIFNLIDFLSPSDTFCRILFPISISSEGLFLIQIVEGQKIGYFFIVVSIEGLTVFCCWLKSTDISLIRVECHRKHTHSGRIC